MSPGDLLLLLAAVAAGAAVVLTDIAAYERPARERRPRAPRPERATRVRPSPPAGPTAVEPAEVVEVPEPAGDGTWLGALATTEQDERSAARRVGSALLLLTLTLAAAGLVGAAIYRGLSGLG
ncbi:MAG TPA: hypothetical protein VF519_07215 [Mycobacteriales bacterium]